MMPNIVLFSSLILCSNCLNIFTEVKIDKGSMTSLNTSINDTTFFYITLQNSDIAGIIYFHITDKNYNLNFNNIKTCYTIKEANLDSTIADCEGDWKELTPYEKIEENNPKEYFYKHAYIPHTNERYLIVKYSGKNEDGELKAESSLTDIYEKLKDLLDSALSVLAIIGIVIGSIIGALLVLGLICGLIGYFIEKSEKSEKSEKTTENTDSKPAIEIPDKTDEAFVQEEKVENTDSKPPMEIQDKADEPLISQSSEETQN